LTGFFAQVLKTGSEKESYRVAMATAEEKFVAEVTTDPNEPVVLFALEWCEFCWSVRNFFKKVGIVYRSVDLDSVEFQQDQRGRKIRAVLKDQTGFETIPQIFIGGEFIGGCTDIFDAWKDGSVQVLLKKNGVDFDVDIDADPYTFLPAWLHPR
jgi:cysteine synthase A